MKYFILEFISLLGLNFNDVFKLCSLSTWYILLDVLGRFYWLLIFLYIS